MEFLLEQGILREKLFDQDNKSTMRFEKMAELQQENAHVILTLLGLKFLRAKILLLLIFPK